MDATTVEANNAFGFDLLQRVREDSTGNVIFSPVSLSIALTMTAAGAQGGTRDQMLEVLHLGPDLAKVQAEYRALLARWVLSEKPYLLEVANRLWVDQGFSLLPSYLSLVENNFGAEPKTLNITGNPEEARRAINAWTSEQTHGRIEDLIPAGNLNADSQLVLTNAIYFFGEWARKFDPDRTRNEDFYLDAANQVNVPFMHETNRYRYAETDAFQLLEMSYKGGDLSMVILLPRARDGIAALERDLTSMSIEQLLAQASMKKVIVTLPKFRIEKAFGLEEVLRKMGMGLAFSGAADFSGMTGGRDLMIGFVRHKAFIDVNEDRTEAAAATAVSMMPAAAPPRPEPPIVFRADHSFLFLIRDRTSGAILFLGRLANPRGVKEKFPGH